MQFQQTGTEPEYNDLVQFLPRGSFSAVSRAEYSSGLLKNPYPTGQKEARGALLAGRRRRLSNHPVLTDLEHPGPTLDPHAFSVGSRPNDQHLVILTLISVILSISFKLAKTTIRIAHKLVGRKRQRGKNSNRGPTGYGSVGEKIT